jgi:hypothetical protein
VVGGHRRYRLHRRLRRGREIYVDQSVASSGGYPRSRDAITRCHERVPQRPSEGSDLCGNATWVQEERLRLPAIEDTIWSMPNFTRVV